MSDLPIQQVLMEAIAQIERLGIPYAVMGGFAARAWGLPRPTYDADIAIAVSPEGLQRLFDAFEQQGFDVPPEHRSGFLDTLGELRKAKVTRFAGNHVWSTDLFMADGAFLQSALGRARPAPVGAARARVMSAEDIVLLKLLASRRKDLADIEEITLLCPALDKAYLRQWAQKMGVQSRLEEFFPPGSGA